MWENSHVDIQKIVKNMRKKRYKAGQIFTHENVRFRISYAKPKISVCRQCGDYHRELGMHSPCMYFRGFPCVKYCEMNKFPKIIKPSCGNQVNE